MAESDLEQRQKQITEATLNRVEGSLHLIKKLETTATVRSRSKWISRIGEPKDYGRGESMRSLNLERKG